MWIVVHFIDDESVEAVPEIWFRKNKCAWPINKTNVKKLIEKGTYPNQLEFKWLPARMLGSTYNTLESARYKSNRAQYLTDLSTNEDPEITKEHFLTKKSNYQSKRIASPTILKTGKRFKKNSVLINAEETENEDDMVDSDKDPDFVVNSVVGINDDTIQSSPPGKRMNTPDVSYIHSPIGKVMVENINSLSGQRSYSDTSRSTSFTKRSLNLKTVSNDKIQSTSPGNTSNICYIQFPIGKVMVENINSLSEQYSYGKSTSIAKRSLDFEIKSTGQPISNFSRAAATTKNIPVMSHADFQAFVINTLTKLKFEVSSMSTTINTNYLAFEAFYKNIGQSSALNLSNNLQQSFDISGIFPLCTEEQLNNVEEKLKLNGDFKLNMIAKLSLFVGIKNVGESVRRLMARMFSDELLQNYSLLGFKKKNRFSDLLINRLIIDAIRVQSKFSNVLDKEIDVPLATWLSHTKFRIKDKHSLA